MPGGAKVLMVSHARQLYAGRVLLPHTLFEVDNEQDASDLETLGFAVRATVAETPVEVVNKPAKPPKGTYSRRDMRAKP